MHEKMHLNVWRIFPISHFFVRRVEKPSNVKRFALRFMSSLRHQTLDHWSFRLLNETENQFQCLTASEIFKEVWERYSYCCLNSFSYEFVPYCEFISLHEFMICCQPSRKFMTYREFILLYCFMLHNELIFMSKHEEENPKNKKKKKKKKNNNFQTLRTACEASRSKSVDVIRLIAIAVKHWMFLNLFQILFW